MMLKRDYEFVKADQPHFDDQRYHSSRRNQLLHIVSNVNRESQRTYPISRPSRLGRQTEESNERQQRRRIAVACSRCRKRKIRCTGAVGVGQGCKACVAAGAEFCNFMRVGSHDVNSLVGTTSPHDIHNISTTQPNVSTSGPPRSCIEYQSLGQASMARSMTDDWTSGYDQESVETWSLAPVVTDTYHTPYTMSEVERPWSATLSERPALNTYYEPEPVSTYTNSIPMSIPQSQTNTGQSQVRILHSTDRILPVPTAILRPQYSTPANLNEVATRTSSLSLHPVMNIYSRPHIAWENSFESRSRSGSTEALSFIMSKPTSGHSSSSDLIAHSSSGVECLENLSASEPPLLHSLNSSAEQSESSPKPSPNYNRPNYDYNRQRHFESYEYDCQSPAFGKKYGTGYQNSETLISSNKKVAKESQIS